MVKKNIFFGTSLIFVLSGCTVQRGAEMPVPRPLGAQYATLGQEHSDLPAEHKPVPVEPTGTLNLPQALALALLHNPELEAFAYEVRAAEARVLQARLLPNPKLEVKVGEYNRDGAGFDSAETVVTLGQLFELGGKRHWRTRMARAEGELAGWDYESKRLDVFTSTAQRFMNVVAAQRRLEIASSMVELAEKTSRAVDERVQAGKEPPLQASKASAELELARMNVLEARSALEVSRKTLSMMWGAEQPEFQTLECDLDTVLESIPSMEALRSRLSMNPDLERWETELRLRSAAVSSEKAARMPDVKATVGLQRFEEDGTDSLAFGVGVPLPLFDRNQGNIAARKYELAKAEAKHAAARNALAAELSDVHASLNLAHQRVQILRSNVLPTMEKALETAHEGYRRGKFGVLDMLDAQRSLFEAKGALVDALAAYHAALATIQRITGTGIEELLEIKLEEVK